MKTLSPLWTATLAGLLAVAFPAAGQTYAVVVHPANPVSNLTVAALRDLFGGAVTHWPDRSKVVLVHRATGSPANRFLIDRFLKTSWQDYKRSMEGLEFQGQEPVVIRVLNSDAAACKFVFNVPSAVAVIESASAAVPECRDVRVLKIDGLTPGQGGYRLK